ncbi:hypothetical protein ACFOUO_09890 [Salinithrix halophila]|uniref:Uncharacterized protein n=1 Tax=Salinithrix halophila TaxID=1485204 RepID=A0ABV8JIE6_9BACL
MEFDKCVFEERKKRFLSLFDRYFQVNDKVKKGKISEGDLTLEFWKVTLPKWFVQFSDSNINYSEDVWELDSWLYAMDNRPWNWWSYWVENNILYLELQVHGHPYTVETVIYVADVLNANKIDVLENYHF